MGYEANIVGRRVHTSQRMAIANGGVTEGRCEECGQVHLSPGYCQALDPNSVWHTSRLGLKWKAAHPDRWPVSTEPSNTEAVRLPDEANKSNQSNFDKASYQRDYMRRRREAAKLAATEAGDD